MNKIVVRSEHKKYEASQGLVKKAVHRSLDFFNKDGYLLEINLVDGREMRRLNRETRKKDRDTNVLSFSEPINFPHPETNLQPLGEVYLSPDYIKKKGESLTRLAVHGTLHLLGFSHARVGDRIKMERIEDKILS
jgi:probable rRNA maturation factor